MQHLRPAWPSVPVLLLLGVVAACGAGPDGAGGGAVEAAAAPAADTPTPDAPSAEGGSRRLFDLVFQPVDDEAAAAVEVRVARGIAATETFFGAPFPQRFRVEVFPDRVALDRSFPTEWGLTQSQSWMVASGVATDLRILSPRVWTTEASGHDPADERHVQGIVTHELVHVYHGQHNANGDFDGMDAMGWFLEGVAVFASGQLDEGHVAPAREALAHGQGPRQLATAWSGKYRYGVSGSLVQYVDSLVGRAKLREMLAATTQEDLLRLAGVTEAELLDGWARWVEGR